MNLRRRIGLALTGVPVAITALFALIIWLVYAGLESQTLDRLLGRELSVLVQANAAPADTDTAATGLHYYRPARWPSPAPPAELARLAPGSYRDFALPGGSYHVLVRELAAGDRAYLSYDVQAFELRERYLRAALLAGVLCAGLLAWLCAGWIAARVLRPLDAVVARIRALDVQGGAGRLGCRPEDAELAPVVQAFNERLAEIERLLTREHAFAAAASHELRTPLAVIRGGAEVLAVRHGGSAVLERIERAVAEATQNLDALLALSRFRQLPAPERLELHRLLPALAEPYGAAAQAQGASITWNLQPCVIEAPAGALGIIFTNLLRNALRAAAAGAVRVELDAQRLVVADDGPGIAAEDLPGLFEPGARHSGGGTGMGLYIARTLAQRCGFSLQLHSAPGGGTRAELLLRAG